MIRADDIFDMVADLENNIISGFLLVIVVEVLWAALLPRFSRLAKLDRYAELGVDPYPRGFERSHRLGAIVAAILLLISPSFLYYSRYIRNDIYIAVWTILLIAALFHFIQSHKPGWFLMGAAVLMLSLATKENAYIDQALGTVINNYFESMLDQMPSPP